ncbi:MAG: serine/threonine-protein phosphatase [Deltaproteobacteria bacterium]|nr:serine/threonine-protein phosphatase [Deltaproteobacteria bacterium]
MKVLSWARTDVGRKRDHNEDSHLVRPEIGLFAVADGMGGHVGGEQASRLAVQVLAEAVGKADLAGLAPGPIHPRPAAGLRDTMRFEDADSALDKTDPGIPRDVPDMLEQAARRAGASIFDRAQREPELAGMGTTLTAMMVHGDRVHFAHVGDSRAYLYRNGRIEQVTEDHSWIAEQVRAGLLSESEASESRFKHIITRSVGFEREVAVDLLGRTALPGDCYVLCSDGMSNYIDGAELGGILSTTYYCKVPELLCELANQRGGDDNITVVVIYLANHA